jgi:hypothetical protein
VAAATGTTRKQKNALYPKGYTIFTDASSSQRGVLAARMIAVFQYFMTLPVVVVVVDLAGI